MVIRTGNGGDDIAERILFTAFWYLSFDNFYIEEHICYSFRIFCFVKRVKQLKWIHF